ncbi:prolyl oligopeptidase [Idiomarina fontislapidosi]|uniref:prolyl oligopeptidase n=1 Tax=Idiomarina fontislapidosi TaxID=263723 RepID=A0A432XUQ5_9GAMM|nr:prolyl oligopeptidase family serine peptidase [Idiomarina fontislapidosi]PYE31868.1 prolyl oligopeptidase [Idiomarina fontislapidosi]RUO52460.1 S9 family peptidase [Idiomarina fontislapidosi]
MKMIRIVSLLIVTLVSACSSQSDKSATPENPYGYPAINAEPANDDYHGKTVTDEFRVLEHEQKQGVQQWLSAQRAFSQQHLDELSSAEFIRQRLTELSNYERTSAPIETAGHWFYLQNDGLQHQSVLYARHSDSGAPHVIVDPNLIDDKGTTSIHNFSVSPDGSLIAYALSQQGSDWVDWYVTSVAKPTLPEQPVISGVKFTDLAWTANANGFYYSRYPKAGNNEYDGQAHVETYFHRIGTSQTEDQKIETGISNDSYIYTLTHGSSLLVKATAGFDQNNWYLLDNPQQPHQLTAIDFPDNAFATFIGNTQQSLIFKLRGEQGRGRLVAVDRQQPTEPYRVLVDEQEQTLADAVVIKDQLMVHYLDDAQSRLVILNHQGQMLRELALPGQGHISELTATANGDEAFFKFEQFTQPGSIYRYQAAQQRTTLWRSFQQPAGVDDYEATQVSYLSSDQQPIPMFIIGKDVTSAPTQRPTLLVAYGGFGVSMLPAYNPAWLTWLELGGQIAIANVRGGGEFGEQWHEAGRLAGKQQVIHDIEAAAHYLINNQYTRSDQLGFYGRSNGAMLGAAVMVESPDLFSVALLDNGLFDMLRYQTANANAKAWFTEYGLSSNAAQFDTLLSYSPLHNVKPNVCYPATIVSTSQNNTRVAAWHSYKLAAALQRAQGCEQSILLLTQPSAGHLNDRPTWMTIEHVSQLWTFAANKLNMRITQSKDSE